MSESPTRPGSAVSASSRVPSPSHPLPDIDRALGLIVAVFNVLFTSTTWTAFARSAESTSATGTAAVAALLGIPLFAIAVAAVRGRVTQPLWAAAPACYVLALLVWALSIEGPLRATPPPWLLAMLVPVVLQVQMALRRVVATALVTLVLACLLAVVLIVRGHLGAAVVVTETLIVAPPAMLLAIVLALIGRAAARTGRAQQDALERIATARFDDVTEAERVRTDALVHDTVLTTLLQAASAEETEEGDRAMRMAENAVRVLAHIGRTRDLGVGVRLSSAVSAHEERLAPLLRAFEVTLDDRALEDLLLPRDAADAMLEALAAAMEHSIAHADAGRRTVRLRPLGPDGLRIDVHDDGEGFDPTGPTGSAIAARVSAPMLRVEGRAEVRAAPDGGTSVHLFWGSVSVADVGALRARSEQVEA